MRGQANQTLAERYRVLKAGAMGEAETRTWIAILVLTDNCNRQGLGLPNFRTGVRLTSQEVVVALRAVLHPTFLISDPGDRFHNLATYLLQPGYNKWY